MNRVYCLSDFYSKIHKERAFQCLHLTLRHLSSEVISSKSNDPRKKYSHTVVLPKTSFRLRVEPKEIPKNEALVAETAQFQSVYNWQQEILKGEEFVLHDGPPYANGPPHIGHAVNKMLKDIVIRNKVLEGQKVHFVPGWDCHGLPIELKAISQDKDWSHLSPIEVRKKARNFADKAIMVQKEAFQSWGLLADWSKCYYTYNIPYIENQFQQFYNLYEKGFVYRSFLPTYWSPSSRTALAEAELDYNTNHKSTCVVLRLKMQPSSFTESFKSDVYALIWTTTPWTLPANAAIGFNPEMQYSVVTLDNLEDLFIVASPLINQLELLMGTKISVQSTFPGTALESSRYHHPVKPERTQPFLPADFVNADKGTGLVHMAPTHGHDDFALCQRHNIPLEMLVDDTGKFFENAGPGLKGLDVLGDGSEAVQKLLAKDILHTHALMHSYPYDWRTKQPVIIRASKQWFMNLDSIKPYASSYANDIPVLPESLGGKDNLLAKINNRSYWCISRQRVWGIPVPILFQKDSDKVVLSRKLIDHYCSLLKQHGSDFWWTQKNSDLCPVHLAEECGVKPDEIDCLQRSTDIFDIWLDSGLSWSGVLEGRQADLYLEGVDQCTGWFQSSLLTAVALENKSPYKSIFVHGFTVDENGNKMSKSLGNVLDPQEVIHGSKKKGGYGVDVLRWWVAGHTVQHTNIPVSNALLEESQKEVQKLRSSLRFILGNLDGMKCVPSFPKTAKDISKSLIDRFMLHELYIFNQQIQEYYKNYQFNFVRIAIINFVANQLSALYFNAVKDRMYCSDALCEKRNACQVIYYISLEVLLRAISPVLPFLAEEVCQHHDLLKGTPYFKRRPLSPLVLPDTWLDPVAKSEMDVVSDLKYAFNTVKGNQNSWNLHAVVSCGENVLKILDALNREDNDQLLELLQVRSLELVKSNDDKLSVRVELVESALCLRCRRNGVINGSDLCQRCHDVLKLDGDQRLHRAA